MAIPTDHSDVPLAIIGMGCRLPGADDLDQYWELVSQGRSAIAEVPPDRLDQQLYYHPDKGVRGKTYSKLAALLKKGEIDLKRYPIAEELRRLVDPMHLTMTAVAADALRHGGLDPFNLQLKNSAVFIGHAVGSNQLRDLTYASLLDEALSMLDGVEGLKDLAPQERTALIAECRRLASGKTRRKPGGRARAVLQHGGRYGGQGLWPDWPLVGPEFSLRLVAACDVDGRSGVAAGPGRYGHRRRSFGLRRSHAGLVFSRPGDECDLLATL